MLNYISLREQMLQQQVYSVIQTGFGYACEVQGLFLY